MKYAIETTVERETAYWTGEDWSEHSQHATLYDSFEEAHDALPECKKTWELDSPHYQRDEAYHIVRIASVREFKSRRTG